jgi:nitrile hydratase subunit alpha
LVLLLCPHPSFYDHHLMNKPSLPAHSHSEGPDEQTLRVQAIEALLVAKGYVVPETLDRLVQVYEKEVGPHLGAAVIARAWCDPGFTNWLAQDATEAVKQTFGIEGRQGEHLVAVFNSPEVHNLVVCTLCSCYPWTVLGLPPVWYKSAAYRSKAVIDPRGVLQDFGVALPAAIKIRVWDSTAEIRYLVVPLRPAGTERFSESELAALVSRDSMIGTAVVQV